MLMDEGSTLPLRNGQQNLNQDRSYIQPRGSSKRDDIFIYCTCVLLNTIASTFGNIILNGAI